MDSSSRSASPREPSRPSHRPPSPPAAFENKAYQHDDADSNHNTDAMSNGKNHPNDSFGANGEAKTLEAVNLELVNLAPKNGNAKKKDVEVDMNVNNPYEEYFVPVNEHKKYMRGEKLYVTADKRGEKGSCKRPLCWTILGLVVAAVVVLIVLAATGILFSNSPTPVGEYNETISSARALNSITQMVDHDHDHVQDHDHNLDHEHDHDHNEIHDHEHEEPESTVMQNTQDHLSNDGNADESNKNLLSTMDESMYIPRTLEGEIKIDNEEFTPALMDRESPQYKELAAALSRMLADAFANEQQDKGDHELQVEIIDIRNGSIVVTYRLHWKPKNSFANNEDPLMSNRFNENIRSYIKKNSDMLNDYHIVSDSISTKRVLDLCKIDNNKCEQKCEFVEETLDFKCTCYSGYTFNPVMKKCVFGVIDSEQKEYKVISFGSDNVTPKSVPENEEPTNVNISNEPMQDGKEINQYETSTSTEHSVSVEMKHENESNNQQTTIRSMEESHHEHELKHEPSINENTEVIPLLEPTAEQTIEPEPQHETEPEPEPQPEPEPEPKPEPEPEPEPEPQPEEDLVTELAPHAESDIKEEPHAEPTSEPNPNSSRATQVPLGFTMNDEIDRGTNLHPISIVESESSTEPESTSMSKSSEKNDTSIMEIINSRIEPEPSPEPKIIEDHNVSVMETINSWTEPESTPEPKINEEDNKPGMEITKSENENNSPFNPDTFVNRNVHIEEHFNGMKTNIMLETTTDHTVEEKSHENEDSLRRSTISSTENHDIDSNVSENKNSDVENTHLFSRGRNIIIDSEIDTESPLPTTTEWKTNIEAQNGNKFNTSDEDKQDEMDEYLRHDTKNTTQMSFKFPNTDLILETTTQAISDEKINTHTPNDSKEEAISEEFIVTNQVFPNTERTPSMEKHIIMDTGEMELLNNKSNNVIHKTQNFSEENLDFTTITSLNSMNQTPVKGDIEDHTTVQSNEVTIETETDSDFLEYVTETPTMTTKERENKINVNDEGMQTIIPTHHPEITTSELAEVTDSISTNEELERSDKTDMVLFKKALNDQEPINEISKSDETLSSPDEDDKSYKENETTVSNYMLYNRSSKAITSESDEILSTTDSGNEETLTLLTTIKPSSPDSFLETSDQNSTNMLENAMINKNNNSVAIVTKENFDTDYTNSMEPQSPQDHNNPTYQLLHESQNEQKEKIDLENREESLEKLSQPFNVNFETTTVSDYIYRKSNNEENTTETTREIFGSINKKQTELTDNIVAHPAPVWEEEESDTRRGNMEHNPEENKTIAIPVFLQEENNTNTTSDIITSEITTNEPFNQNKTTVSNINVTIYERANHNESNLASSERPMGGTLTQYEEHEHEMNPFLPEIENNKSLVKKLQEGHDLESLHFNETHDSHEEHIMIPTEQENHTKNETKITLIQMSDDIPTTEHDMKEHISNIPMDKNEPTESITDLSHSHDTNDINTRNTNDQVEKETIPTFLLDTSDLLTSTARTSTNFLNTDVRSDDSEENGPSMNVPEGAFLNIPTSSIVNTTENLEVIPLLPESESEEKHRIFKKSKIADIHDINDISDTPKKSDKRTLASKMESKYEV